MTETLEENETISTSIISKIQKMTEDLEELDEYFNNLPELQQQVDYEISDILHFLQVYAENGKKLTARQCSKIVAIIQEKRCVRKALNQESEIKNVYMTNKQKIVHENQRQFFLNELYKKDKSLNEPYKWRVLNEEDILNLIS